MTRDQIIQHLCATMSLAYEVMGNFSRPSDGVCLRCPAQTCEGWEFHNDGHVAEYVRESVVLRLRQQGYDPEKIDHALELIGEEEQR